jgi:hypothetical protein
MVGAAAAGIVRRQKKIAALFQATGATSPDRATTAAALGIDEGLAFRILLRNDILRTVRGDRLYLDESGWEALQARRRRMAILIPAILLLVGMTMMIWAAYR